MDIQKTIYENPATVQREIAILYELGLDESEVNYILYIKYKKEISKKWD